MALCRCWLHRRRRTLDVCQLLHPSWKQGTLHSEDTKKTSERTKRSTSVTLRGDGREQEKTQTTVLLRFISKNLGTMPVIPPGIPPYHIQKPCTMGDNGQPSSSITNDVQRVLQLIDDERHLTAHALYTSILHRIQLYDDDNNKDKHQNDDNDATKNKLPKQKSKSGTTSFLKRSGSSIPKPSTPAVNGGTSSAATTNPDEEMRHVKEILFHTKKHVFDTLEVRESFFADGIRRVIVVGD